MTFEDHLLDYLRQFLTGQHGQDYEFCETNGDCLEILCIKKDPSAEKCMIIRIFINHERRQLFITNIFLPQALRRHRTGKKLIAIVHYFGTQFNYDTFVADLTDTFRERLFRRKAVQTGIFDMLQITQETNLLED